MLICTTDCIPGSRIVATLGFVSGNAVKTRNAGVDVIASFKTVFGGEVSQYTQLMNDTRQLAMQRLEKQAEALGANAVCGLRFVGTEVMQGCSELCAYGTAVVCVPEDAPVG